MELFRNGARAVIWEACRGVFNDRLHNVHSTHLCVGFVPTHSCAFDSPGRYTQPCVPIIIPGCTLSYPGRCKKGKREEERVGTYLQLFRGGTMFSGEDCIALGTGTTIVLLHQFNCTDMPLSAHQIMQSKVCTKERADETYQRR